MATKQQKDTQTTTMKVVKKVVLSPIISRFFVPQSDQEFVVQDHFKEPDKFKVDTRSWFDVKVETMSEDFKKRYLAKVEGPFAGSIVSERKLLDDQCQRNRAILKALGTTAVMTLREVYALMKPQSDRRWGRLHLNHNLLYVEDIDGVLGVLFIYGGIYGGWHIHALNLDDDLLWLKGDRVFSRKFNED